MGKARLGNVLHRVPLDHGREGLELDLLAPFVLPVDLPGEDDAAVDGDGLARHEA
jgi:hypothetical protein